MFRTRIVRLYSVSAITAGSRPVPVIGKRRPSSATDGIVYSEFTTGTTTAATARRRDANTARGSEIRRPYRTDSAVSVMCSRRYA